jgi:hypothetical protein
VAATAHDMQAVLAQHAAQAHDARGVLAQLTTAMDRLLSAQHEALSARERSGSGTSKHRRHRDSRNRCASPGSAGSTRRASTHLHSKRSRRSRSAQRRQHRQHRSGHRHRRSRSSSHSSSGSSRSRSRSCSRSPSPARMPSLDLPGAASNSVAAARMSTSPAAETRPTADTSRVAQGTAPLGEVVSGPWKVNESTTNASVTSATMLQ